MINRKQNNEKWIPIYVLGTIIVLVIIGLSIAAVMGAFSSSEVRMIIKEINRPKHNIAIYNKHLIYAYQYTPTHFIFVPAVNKNDKPLEYYIKVANTKQFLINTDSGVQVSDTKIGSKFRLNYKPGESPNGIYYIHLPDPDGRGMGSITGNTINTIQFSEGYNNIELSITVAPPLPPPTKYKTYPTKYITLNSGTGIFIISDFTIYDSNGWIIPHNGVTVTAGTNTEQIMRPTYNDGSQITNSMDGMLIPGIRNETRYSTTNNTLIITLPEEHNVSAVRVYTDRWYWASLDAGGVYNGTFKISLINKNGDIYYMGTTPSVKKDQQFYSDQPQPTPPAISFLQMFVDPALNKK